MEPALKRVRTGGTQQKLQTLSESTSYQSGFAFWLLTQLAWGFFTIIQCQMIAHLAMQDMRKAGVQDGQFPELHNLAKAGTYGKHRNNVHRDIMAACRTKAELKPFDVNLPFKGFPDQPTKISLPHLQFAHLYETSPEAFEKHMLPDKHELTTFWKSVVDTEAVKGLPDIGNRRWRESAIPLGIHGDEVPITGLGKVWSKCALTFGFFSLMVARVGAATTDLMFWIWACFESVILTAQNEDMGTIDCFMQILKWSFQCLYTGKHPTHDWRGVKRPG